MPNMNSQIHCFILITITFSAQLLTVESLRINRNNKNGDIRNGSTVFGKEGNLFSRAENVKCDNKTVAKMDSLIAKMLTLGQRNRRFPETATELRRFCNEGHKYASFVLGYAKNCFNDFIKRTIRVMQYPIENELKMICKSGRPSKRAQELMTAAKCGNAARAGLQRCNQNLIDALVAMKYMPRDKVLPMGCCQMNVARECAKTEAELEKACTRKTIDYFERYALEMFGGLIRLGCNDYFDNSDRCNRILPALPKLNRTGYVRPKSYFPPSIELIDSLPTFD